MPSRFARLRAIGCTGTMSTKLLVCSRVAGFTQFDLAAFLPNTDLLNGIVGPPILPVGSGSWVGPVASALDSTWFKAAGAPHTAACAMSGLAL